ncbi:hypothetical protein N431DRAFT_554987 [Stipitochalara longipes BDJ]|nr:hypothetical protein N431DRAFT_554987 [Stipitochalara longipes BDJ]
MKQAHDGRIELFCLNMICGTQVQYDLSCPQTSNNEMHPTNAGVSPGTAAATPITMSQPAALDLEAWPPSPKCRRFSAEPPLSLRGSSRSAEQRPNVVAHVPSCILEVSKRSACPGCLLRAHPTEDAMQSRRTACSPLTRNTRLLAGPRPHRCISANVERWSDDVLAPHSNGSSSATLKNASSLANLSGWLAADRLAPFGDSMPVQLYAPWA